MIQFSIPDSTSMDYQGWLGPRVIDASSTYCKWYTTVYYFKTPIRSSGRTYSKNPDPDTNLVQASTGLGRINPPSRPKAKGQNTLGRTSSGEIDKNIPIPNIHPNTSLNH